MIPFFWIIILFILSFFAYILKMLDLKGTLLSFFVGSIIVYFSNYEFLLILILFFILSTGIPKLKEISKKNVWEKRGWQSVLSKGIVPFVIAIIPLSYTIKIYLYTVAVASATADTLSGEMGRMSKKTYLITNLKRVKPGTNGAVSILGEIWALTGSFFISIFSFIFLHNIEFLIFTTIFGFTGSQFDSLFGALFENKNIMNKFQVNLLAIVINTFFACIIFV